MFTLQYGFFLFNHIFAEKNRASTKRGNSQPEVVPCNVSRADLCLAYEYIAANLYVDGYITVSEYQDVSPPIYFLWNTPVVIVNNINTVI